MVLQVDSWLLFSLLHPEAIVILWKYKSVYVAPLTPPLSFKTMTLKSNLSSLVSSPNSVHSILLLLAYRKFIYLRALHLLFSLPKIFFPTCMIMYICALLSPVRVCLHHSFQNNILLCIFPYFVSFLKWHLCFYMVIFLLIH